MKTLAAQKAEDYLWFNFANVVVEESPTLVKFVHNNTVFLEIESQFFQYLYSTNIYDFRRLCSFP